MQWNPYFSSLPGKRKLVRKIGWLENSIGGKITVFVGRETTEFIGRIAKSRVREIDRIPLYRYIFETERFADVRSVSIFRFQPKCQGERIGQTPEKSSTKKGAINKKPAKTDSSKK